VSAEPPAPVSERDALAQLWTGMYDIAEERLAGFEADAPLAPLGERQRLQIHIRRIPLPWLGTHVLFVEEFPHDQPFGPRRRVIISIEPERAADGAWRARQFTFTPAAADPSALTSEDLETVAGCDLFLRRIGSQFRGGTHGRKCLESAGGEELWVDYRVVIGEGLLWYRQRRLTVADNELAEEIAGFPQVADDARLFSCGITWKGESTRVLDNVDLHDRGGRVRFRTPDGRDLLLELHGRDWPLSEGRESLVLILTDLRAGESVGSSWTSLGAARVGLDVGWLAIDCAPVVSETGEQRS
jgi:hypothetical protein